MDNDNLTIGGVQLHSRLLLGTGKFARKDLIRTVLDESGAHIVTVAVRRVDLDAPAEENVLTHIPEQCILMPNTSGARTADEAIRIARLAQAAGCGNWIKIEIIPDNRYLLPDNVATLHATKVLVDEGFIVLPYMNPDLVMGRAMATAGAAAVMPLGAPIGSNRGVKTEELVRIMIQELDVPIIVDAGIGRPSEAALCMEMGAAAVLVNTAIATAVDPVIMGQAFAKAVDAGRMAYLAGPGAVREGSEASSPLTGFLRKEVE